MLSELLDVLNENPLKPDWVGVYHTALEADLPAWQLLQLAKLLWLETNDPAAFDAAIRSL